MRIVGGQQEREVERNPVCVLSVQKNEPTLFAARGSVFNLEFEISQDLARRARTIVSSNGDAIGATDQVDTCVFSHDAKSAQQ